MSTRALLALALLASALACGRLGALKAERFACGTSGDCADGYACVDGECQLAATGGGGGEDGGGTGGGGGGGDVDAGDVDAGDVDAGDVDAGGADAGVDGGVDAGPARDRDAGVACSNTTQCLPGLTCRDGVCCTSDCGAACDRCNAPGNLGTCLPRPAGSVIAACGQYTCDGVDTGCPTACDPDAGFAACIPSATCAGTACQGCWSGITDAFPSASSAWVFLPSPPSLFAYSGLDAGQLQVTVQVRPQSDEAASATSALASGLLGCGVTVELVVPPVYSPTYTGNIGLFQDAAPPRPVYGWTFDVRGLVATWTLASGTTGSQIIVASGGTRPRWLRLEESGGQVLWRTAAATTFTTVHSVTHDGSLDALKLRIDGAYAKDNAGNKVTTIGLDNLNLGP